MYRIDHIQDEPMYPWSLWLPQGNKKGGYLGSYPPSGVVYEDYTTVVHCIAK